MDKIPFIFVNTFSFDWNKKNKFMKMIGRNSALKLKASPEIKQDNMKYFSFFLSIYLLIKKMLIKYAVNPYTIEYEYGKM